MIQPEACVTLPNLAVSEALALPSLAMRKQTRALLVGQLANKLLF